jgi:membrane-associated protein
MNLAEFFSQGLTLVGSFNPKIMVFLFLLCLIGEAIGFFVPYLFETTWLLVGYQLSQRVLSPPDFALLLLTSLAGRQTGALILYQVIRSGSSILAKYKGRFKPKVNIENAFPIKLFQRIDILASPFKVALGRLLWLRIPLTLILGAKGKLKVLLLGVAFSSLVYDGTYATLGAIAGTTVAVEPIRLVLYFLAGLTVLYGITFGLRRLIGRLTRRRQSAG